MLQPDMSVASIIHLASKLQKYYTNFHLIPKAFSFTKPELKSNIKTDTLVLIFTFIRSTNTTNIVFL